MRNFGSASQYTTAGIYTKILATVSSHIRALAVMVLMILFGGAAWGQTTLSGNINWGSSTQNKIYKLASCGETYTITKSKKTPDDNGSYMTFQLPGDAAQGCRLEITLSAAGLGCHSDSFMWISYNDWKDAITLVGGNSTYVWSPSYDNILGYHSWRQPAEITYTGNVNGSVTLTFQDGDTDNSSSYTVSVTCTGCCDLDAEIVVDNL